MIKDPRKCALATDAKFSYYWSMAEIIQKLLVGLVASWVGGDGESSRGTKKLQHKLSCVLVVLYFPGNILNFAGVAVWLLRSSLQFPFQKDPTVKWRGWKCGRCMMAKGIELFSVETKSCSYILSRPFKKGRV